MKKSLLLLPLVLIASALALAACGGGGSSSGGSEESSAIEETIETSMTTNDPANCTEVQTEAFNEQDQALSEEEPLAACEESQEEESELPESIEISNVNVEGETATAEVAVTGSALNGQAIEFELVEEEEAWKLNHMVKFTEYDGQALAEAFEASLEEEGALEASEVSCIGEAIAAAPQAEIEELSFEGNAEVINAIVESCE